MFVRRADAELAKKHVAQLRIVVLSRVHQHLCAESIEHADHGAQPDDLGPRAEQRHELHVVTR